MPLHIQTPLIQSIPMGQACGRTALLKTKALRPFGSFKIRGIGHACEEHVRRGAKRFASSCGGNAGSAVAYARRCLSIPVVVVVSETTSDRAKSLLAQEKASVIVHGATCHEANALAQSLTGEGVAFLHPFDDPLLWEGHATLIDEAAQTGLKPDAIVLSVGGGGLRSGAIHGMRRNGWGNVPILAVEIEGAASLHQSMKQGHRVELERINNIATSLGAKQVCEPAFALTKSHDIRSALASDSAAFTACKRYFQDHQLLSEPACGASLALGSDNSDALSNFKTITVVVCGGATASEKQLNQWANAYVNQ